MQPSYHRRIQTPIINVMVGAIEKATKRLRRDFSEVEHLQMTQKGPSNFVSHSDMYTEQILVKELQQAYPSYSFLLAKGREIRGNDPDRCWIVTPLDGVTNFLHGIPHFAISIALMHKDQSIASVVYDVMKDELFWAAQGKGAFLENRRLYVSSRKNLTDALFLTELAGPDTDRAEKVRMMHARATQKIGCIRSFGSAALSLAYIASARAEIYVEYEIKPWAVAAGTLIVEEAGGIICTFENEDRLLNGASMLASNKLIHQKSKALLIT